MNLRTSSLLFTAFGAVALSSVASAQVTFNVAAGTGFDNIAGNTANTISTVTVSSDFVLLPSLNILSATNLLRLRPNDVPSENRFRFRQSAAPTLFAEASLGSGAYVTTIVTSGIAAVTVSTRTVSGSLVGTIIPNGSTFSCEFFNSIDDGAGFDATVDTAFSFRVNGSSAPTAFDSGVLAGPFNSAGSAFDAGNSSVTLGTVGASFVMSSFYGFEGVNTNVLSANSPAHGRIRIRNSAYPSFWTMELLPTTASAYSGGTISVSSLAILSPSDSAVFSNRVANTLRGLNMPAGSTFSAEFHDGFDNGAGPDSTWSNVRIRFGNGPAIGAPAAPPASFVDLGTLSDANSTVATAAFGAVPLVTAGQISWFRFTLPQNVSGAAGRFVHIWVSANAPSAAVSDSLMNLFDNTGRHLAYDDDSGLSLFSSLTFGAGGLATPWTLTSISDAPWNGRDGEGLPAGTYWIGVGAWASNDTFSDGFVMTTTNATTFTNGVRVNVVTNVPNNQVISGNMTLQDTLNPFAGARSISYAVKQGTTTVATGTVSASTPTTSYSITLPSSLSGAATIEWDGASFLLRKTAVNLTGANQSGINASLQNGDSDNSGEVDAADIDLVIADFGGTGITTDVDASGEVDAADIDIVIANFGGFND